jgi:hypothetical protein
MMKPCLERARGFFSWWQSIPAVEVLSENYVQESTVVANSSATENGMYTWNILTGAEKISYIEDLLGRAVVKLVPAHAGGAGCSSNRKIITLTIIIWQLYNYPLESMASIVLSGNIGSCGCKK